MRSLVLLLVLLTPEMALAQSQDQVRRCLAGCNSKKVKPEDRQRCRAACRPLGVSEIAALEVADPPKMKPQKPCPIGYDRNTRGQCEARCPKGEHWEGSFGPSGGCAPNRGDSQPRSAAPAPTEVLMADAAYNKKIAECEAACRANYPADKQKSRERCIEGCHKFDLNQPPCPDNKPCDPAQHSAPPLMPTGLEADAGAEQCKTCSKCSNPTIGDALRTYCLHACEMCEKWQKKRGGGKVYSVEVVAMIGDDEPPKKTKPEVEGEKKKPPRAPSSGQCPSNCREVNHSGVRSCDCSPQG